MNGSPDGLLSFPTLRNSYKWLDRFTVRQISFYNAENHRVLDLDPAPPERPKLKAFLGAWPSALDPPDCNFTPLSVFLAKADERDLEVPTRAVALRVISLIDDRKDPFGLKPRVQGQPSESNGEKRPWDAQGYYRDPPKGEDIWRRALDERALYRRLVQNRENIKAERRTLFITDLSPLCATALAITIASDFAIAFREHLQRYVCNLLSFRVKLTNRLFVMEFQMPYLALRTGESFVDHRGIRMSHEMLKHDSRRNMYYYEAQVAFLMTGYDEWHWTAYCYVDTFFGSEKSPSECLDYFPAGDPNAGSIDPSSGIDGPSGSDEAVVNQVWNPREYFLLVFSQRLSQVTREWRNIVSELDSRLNLHETYYYRTINTDDFFDDRDLSRTKLYTHAVSMLRQFHDMLLTTTTSFQEFAETELRCFQSDSDAVNELWKGYLTSMIDDAGELRSMQRRLAQRISTFDRMKEGLVNASALKENRSIGVLTYATVAYLPFNLGAAIFSISNDSPKKSRVLYFVATSVVLAVFTIFFAFKAKLKKSLMRCNTL